MLQFQPWPHLLIDDFLPGSVLAQALDEIASDCYEFEIESRGTGRIEFSLLKSKTLWRALYSKRTVSLLYDAFGHAVTLDKPNMLQLRRMNELTPAFPLHNDSTAEGETIASFLYLSPGWSSGCGGRLQLFESKEQSKPSISIEPMANRLVAFQTKPSYWHSVERVYCWERLSIVAIWNISASEAS